MRKSRRSAKKIKQKLTPACLQNQHAACNGKDCDCLCHANEDPWPTDKGTTSTGHFGESY